MFQSMEFAVAEVETCFTMAAIIGENGEPVNIFTIGEGVLPDRSAATVISDVVAGSERADEAFIFKEFL